MQFLQEAHKIRGPSGGHCGVVGVVEAVITRRRWIADIQHKSLRRMLRAIGEQPFVIRGQRHFAWRRVAVIPHDKIHRVKSWSAYEIGLDPRRRQIIEFKNSHLWWRTWRSPKRHEGGEKLFFKLNEFVHASARTCDWRVPRSKRVNERTRALLGKVLNGKQQANA